MVLDMMKQSPSASTEKKSKDEPAFKSLSPSQLQEAKKAFKVSFVRKCAPEFQRNSILMGMELWIEMSSIS